jgi:hypothetical protein
MTDLKPGIELDALIAENVMGIPVKWEGQPLAMAMTLWTRRGRYTKPKSQMLRLRNTQPTSKQLGKWLKSST